MSDDTIKTARPSCPADPDTGGTPPCLTPRPRITTPIAVLLTAIGTTVAVLGLMRLFRSDAIVEGAQGARVVARLERLEELGIERDELIHRMSRRQEYLLLLTRDIARKVGVNPGPVPLTDRFAPEPFIRGLMGAYAGELESATPKAPR